MGILENLDTGSKVLYSTGYFSGNYNQDLFLKKSISDVSNKDKFYISVYSLINGELRQQGYLYFYLDYKTKSSYFIGMKVKPEYRNLNIGSFLVASWIDLCMNNGYDFLGVNERQRKPFLLYLLKTFGFEIFDKSLYDFRPDVISIYKNIDLEDRRKFLSFRDSKHEKVFMNTNIYKADNYEIIHSDNDMILLDKIIMPLQSWEKNKVNYQLFDEDLAKVKTKNTISSHTR